MELDHSKVAPNQFNALVGHFPYLLWDKSPLDDSELARLTPILEFLRDITAAGRHEVFDYLTKWLALPLQHPGTKTGVCIVLHSQQQGTGKGLVARGLMKAIYGDGYFMCNSEDQLFGRFNAASGASAM